jgi:hypothetical protein
VIFRANRQKMHGKYEYPFSGGIVDRISDMGGL